jgi:hypothetical protein
MLLAKLAMRIIFYLFLQPQCWLTLKISLLGVYHWAEGGNQLQCKLCPRERGARSAGRTRRSARVNVLRWQLLQSPARSRRSSVRGQRSASSHGARASASQVRGRPGGCRWSMHHIRALTRGRDGRGRCARRRGGALSRPSRAKALPVAAAPRCEWRAGIPSHFASPTLATPRLRCRSTRHARAFARSASARLRLSSAGARRECDGLKHIRWPQGPLQLCSPRPPGWRWRPRRARAVAPS